MVIRSYPEVAGLPGIKTVEPGLVHRLDRDTSGLVVVARTAAVFRRASPPVRRRRGAEDTTSPPACAPTGRAAGAVPAAAGSRAGSPPTAAGRRMVRAVLPGEKSRKLLGSRRHGDLRHGRAGHRARGRAGAARSVADAGVSPPGARAPRLPRLPHHRGPAYGAAVPAVSAADVPARGAHLDDATPPPGRPLVVESPLPGGVRVHRRHGSDAAPMKGARP